MSTLIRFPQFIKCSFFCLLLLIRPDIGKSQSRYQIIYEPGLGMNFGAENIATVGYLWQKLDHKFIPIQLFHQTHTGSKIGNIAYRLGKLFLLNYPITFILPSIQHERFGHGSRATEFSGTIESVQITLPPPFQFRLPSISTSNTSLQTPQQILVETIGGSEANFILSDILRKNILLDHKLDYHTAFMYLYANNDLAGYAGFAANIATSDIRIAVDNLNSQSQNNSGNLTLKRVQLYGILSIVLDPLNYYALKSIFWDYVWSGQYSKKINLIPLGPTLHYLPKASFNFAPYGVEINLQNYLKHKRQLYALNISHTDGTFENAWRLSAQAWNLTLTNRISFNLAGEIWQQPEISFYKENNLLTTKGFGGAIVATTYYDLIKQDHQWGLVLQLGYKSKGFMKGEILDNGVIIRGGISLRIK
ncbi:hypothetical protein BKI52_08355 [marine bacterium AO1-C]|nr:hypothetical protein BKI52_08355 [marine bacterium AO1-C]